MHTYFNWICIYIHIYVLVIPLSNAVTYDKKKIKKMKPFEIEKIIMQIEKKKNLWEKKIEISYYEKKLV